MQSVTAFRAPPLDFHLPKSEELSRIWTTLIWKHRRTSSQLVRYTQLLYNLLEKKRITVYFDIMKAFESLFHDLFLEKLRAFVFDEKFLVFLVGVFKENPDSYSG